MGEVEIDEVSRRLIIHSHIVTYGNSADPALTESIRDEIETMWNDPRTGVKIGRTDLVVTFRITAVYLPAISDMEIYQNMNPRNNYFRIEEFAHGNISF